MGSKEGAAKARMYLIEQYGSLENYKEAMRRLATKGGGSTKRDPSTRLFTNTTLASEAGKKSGVVRRAKADEKQS